MKPATFAPWYAALYPQFAEIARKHGYALAVHGSLARDFDVVAIPWADKVSPHRNVIDDVLSQFAVTEIGQPETKNHGRVAYTLSIGFGDCFADWSFMQPQPAPDERVKMLEEIARRVVAWQARVDDVDDDLEYLNRDGGWEDVMTIAAEARALLNGGEQ